MGKTVHEMVVSGHAEPVTESMEIERVEPLGTMVLVTDGPVQKTDRGLLIPESHQRPAYTLVLAVGPDCKKGLKPGDKVTMDNNSFDIVDGVKLKVQGGKANNALILMHGTDPPQGLLDEKWIVGKLFFKESSIIEKPTSLVH